MSHRRGSLLLLTQVALSPPSLLNSLLGPAGAFIAPALAVLTSIYFWWAHGFRLQPLNLRILAWILALMIPAGWLGGGIGVTGLSRDFVFNPEDLRSLKRSDRVALRLVFDHEPSDDERYLRLGFQESAASTPNSQSLHWVQANLAGESLDHQLSTLQDWFHQSFTYSLESDWKGLDSFLFVTRQGYCLHFSYALKELLSMSGEKAKMTYGYAGGSWNPVLRTLTYLDSDAHSWIEVWDRDHHRHRRVDPTSWVTRIRQENESLPNSLFGISLGIGIFLGIWLWLGFGRNLLGNPRERLATLLKTPGPISEGLEQKILRARVSNRPRLAKRLELLKRDYEHLYFAPKGSEPRSRRLRSSLWLRLRIALLYDLDL